MLQLVYRQLVLIGCVALLSVSAHADISSLLEPIEKKHSHEYSDGDSSEKSVRKEQGYVYPNEMLATISSLLLQRFNSSGDLRLRPDKNWSPIKIEEDRWSIEVLNVVPNNIAPRMVIHFRLKSGTKIVGEWQVPVQAELWTDVYSLTKPLNRNESIKMEDVKVITVNALKHHNALVEATTDITRYELFQTVNIDDPLYWKNIRATPMIRQGQVIDVLAQEGFMKISTKGLAMQDGAKGELITVRNLKSKKEFQAQVINENSAKVYF
jgi:flagella basal body P-ring formation protein FlgA